MAKRLACATLLLVTLSMLCVGLSESATEPNAFGAERRMQSWDRSENGWTGNRYGGRGAASTDPSEIPGLLANIPLGNITVSPEAADVQAAIAQAGPPFYSVSCGAEFNYYTGQTIVGCSGQPTMWKLHYQEHTDVGVTQSVRSSVTFSIPTAPSGQVVRHAELELLLPTKVVGGQTVPWTGLYAGSGGSALTLNGKSYTLRSVEYGFASHCSGGWTSTVARVAWDFTAEVAGLAAAGGGLLELSVSAPPVEPDPIQGGETAEACARWSGGQVLKITFGPPAPGNRAKDVAQGPPSGPPGQDQCLEYVGSPINLTTGNMYTQQEDLAYPSAFGRFVFVRTYNSQSTYAGPLGVGWTHPYDYELQDAQPGFIRVQNGAGNVRYYEAISGGSTYRVAAPARDTSTLTKHANGYTETEQGGLRRDFDLNGRLLTVTTRAGWTTALTYADGRLATVTDPGGRTLTFSYLGDGRLGRVDGPAGLFAQYVYENAGQLSSVSDGAGTRWAYSYTATTPPRLASVRDANGNILEQHTYDETGRVIETSRAGGVKALALEYLDGNQTRVTDSLGRVTTYSFEVFGELPLVTQVDGPCPCGRPDISVVYDSQGRRSRETDARGNVTQFEYDAVGNLVTVIDALGQRSTRTYDAFGQVLTVMDTIGESTTYAYDETTGVLRQLIDALGHVVTITPDVRSLPGAITDPRGFSRQFTYTPSGALATLTDPSGAAAVFSYDSADRLTEHKDALGGTTQYRYDNRGRLASVTDPTGAVTAFAYDPAGNRTSVTAPTGRTTGYSYDTANRLVQVTDPDAGVTRYAYDLESNLGSITDPRGSTTAFAYDAHNRLVRRTDPLGAAETFQYDAAGNLVGRMDRNGYPFTFTYDALNRLTAKSPGGFSYTYDPVGRLVRATNYDGTVTFSYDRLGRVETTTDADGRTLTSTYDPAGNRLALQDDTGTLISYAYDPRNLLTSLTDPRLGTFAFGYDTLGRRTTLTRPNSTTTIAAYDAASRLAALAHTGPVGAMEVLTYLYDPAGNRAGDTRNDQTRRYVYDPLDQLIQVQRENQRGRWRTEEAYAYDPAGNRMMGPAGETYIYDPANRLTSDGISASSYDANGNLIQQLRLADGVVTSYYYDPENRLTWVVTPTMTVQFRYDALGRRIERTVTQASGGGEGEDGEEEGPPPQATRYLYDGEDILATFNRRDRERARYLHGPGIDEPLAQIRPVGARFYHADVLGSIIALTDSTGTLERRYRYDAFGVPQDHLKDPQPYRYTGREWDRDTGLYFYRARYYDPVRGRFVRQDPLWWIGNGSYTYVHNKPLDFLDPFGLQATLPLSGPLGGPLMPPIPLLPSPPLSPGQVRALQHDLASLAALLDPRPLGEYLFSKVLDKIKNDEPLTPEDIAELGNAPKDLICEIRVPSAPPEPPIDPKNPRPPEGGWEKVKFILAQILRLLGQYAGRR